MYLLIHLLMHIHTPISLGFILVLLRLLQLIVFGYRTCDFTQILFPFKIAYHLTVMVLTVTRATPCV
jgi:hypothetical protein